MADCLGLDEPRKGKVKSIPIDIDHYIRHYWPIIVYDGQARRLTDIAHKHIAN
jgi:hypothetical protein